MGRFQLKRKVPEKKDPMQAKKLTAKERLFDLLIHDLTSPLSVISVSATNLLRNADRNGPLTERQKSGLDRISRNVDKAQEILREMIEILRTEAGWFRKELFLVEDNLYESILDVLEVESQGVAEILRREKDANRFCKLLEPHGIFVEITGKFRESPFCHDPRKVRYILRNLLSNAVKYRRKRVTVSIRGDVNLLVSVGDDGPGIPQGEQEAVFERFVRLKDKEHPYAPGLGLGLAGLKALVEAMGGNISLESREGVGTQFSVDIPPLQ
ncbi:MAG: HAMP domain-containing histidine kinase [Deltaproteobacteria bacterium]|nr:MAG: HAMP domain-containing histidine kinase [Deltaproteobacteria bacterium]